MRCINEIGNIEKMVRKVCSLSKDFHLLIIDDGSPNGTAQKVKDLQSEFNGRLFIIERKGKLGLGTAYITGFHWALERAYQYIFEMDCDFSHNPEDLIRLYAASTSGNADVAVGSRYVKGGGFVNWPADRIFISKGASYYLNFITWMGVKDPTAGFICYKRKELETIDLDKIQFVGYAFQIEMKFAYLHPANSLPWTANDSSRLVPKPPLVRRLRPLGASRVHASAHTGSVELLPSATALPLRSA